MDRKNKNIRLQKKNYQTAQEKSKRKRKKQRNQQTERTQLTNSYVKSLFTNDYFECKQIKFSNQKTE